MYARRAADPETEAFRLVRISSGTNSTGGGGGNTSRRAVGLPQIFYKGAWGFLSYYGWDWRAAVVACRALGWGAGYAISSEEIADYVQSNGNFSSLSPAPMYYPGFACEWWEGNLSACARARDYSIWATDGANGSYTLAALVCNNGEIPE
jgi:hypothetical protein